MTPLCPPPAPPPCTREGKETAEPIPSMLKRRHNKLSSSSQWSVADKVGCKASARLAGSLGWVQPVELVTTATRADTLFCGV